jgi:hypothetical protein
VALAAACAAAVTVAAGPGGGAGAVAAAAGGAEAGGPGAPVAGAPSAPAGVTAAAVAASPGDAEIRALLRAGKSAEAHARADALLAVRPADPALLVLAGDAARAAGDRAGAAKRYARAFEAAGRLPPDRKAPPTFADAANALARLKIEDGDGTGAEKVLAFAYLHYPTDRDTVTNLAVAAALRGDWERADRFLRRGDAGDVLIAELSREVARMRPAPVGGAGGGGAGAAAAPAPAVAAAKRPGGAPVPVPAPVRIVVESFGTDGSAGHRAGWGVAVAALVRRALVPGDVPALTVVASLAPAGGSGMPAGGAGETSPAPTVLVTGNVADAEPALAVTVRALRWPSREELGAFEVRVANPAALRAALAEPLAHLRPRLRP